MASTAAPEPLLELEEISLSFGSRPALDAVSLRVERGEIHAIVGEHGAGKTSLALAASGFLRPQSGRILAGGGSWPWLSRERASSLGIEFVPQEAPVFENMNVAESILLDGDARVFPLIRRKREIKLAGAFMASLGIGLDPGARMRELHVSDRALVDVLRNLYRRPRVLIIDEALERLSSEGLARVLPALKAIAASGGAVVYITHRIDDVFKIAQRVTIMRDGRAIFTERTGRLDEITLVRLAYTQTLRGEGLGPDLSFARLVKYNEAILAELPISLIVADAALRPVFVNARARALFGGEGAASLAELLGPGNEAAATVAAEACAGSETKSFYGLPMRAGGGETRSDLIVHPVSDREERIGSVIAIEDVTERERLREAASLSENLASLGLLAAGVAHEINNPLDIIGYYLQSMRFATVDERLLSAVSNVEEEVASIASIVGNLITFSEKRGREAREFDLGELASDLVDLLRFGAEGGGIALSATRPSGAPLLVRADRNELKQALLNLIRNAFEAMPGGGRVDVSCGSAGGMATVAIRDTGPGIEPSRLGEVFLPFYSTKTGGKNSGLGLSISYGIVKRYGGDISAENAAGGGCVFTLSLPLAGQGEGRSPR